jgi:hypothetical protein
MRRGRAAAVIVSIEHYRQIKEDLERLDELELAEMVERARAARRAGGVLSHAEPKRRLGAGEALAEKSGATNGKVKS